MKFTNYIRIVVSNLLNNVHLLGKCRLCEEFLALNPHANQIKESIIFVDQIKKNLVELYYAIHENLSTEYANELKYLQSRKVLDMIPYEQQKKIAEPIQAEFDSKKKLPFVVHNGKRLYFPKHWSLDESKSQYQYFVERENLLGGNYTSKAPHQYQTKIFQIESGDVLLDVGCAEGLVALDVIEKVKRAILFESDPIWEAPLKATFEPYKDKVKIINKWVSDIDNETSVTLRTSTQGLEKETFFVKMDIEGAEELVVKGNSDFFKNRKVKAACCTYHKYNHFEILNETFMKWGYSTEPSDGYILCFMDNVFAPPYFRKGLIRATNIKQ